ncbi:hypothetical protein [Mycobacteroides abscessus]|uniref:hypothetical protein n=1 Tax=Mycobacteroides abscessus TaxID=36809 RepID=UPI000C25A838|nr:hypothetical protein [Mycobacteroides abscessus]
MSVESAVERIVYDCAADIDLEEIEEMLASVRSQLPNPESVLWRYDKCELETYTALSAELKVNPRALNAEIQHACACAQIGMEFRYSEDEEGEAA